MWVIMKKTAFIFVLLLWTVTGGAALSPETFLYEETENSDSDFWFHVQEGNFVVTKVIMFDETGEFACAVDVRGRQKLVPGFAVAADRLFFSSLGNTPENETCDSLREQRLVEMARAYTLEQEVQVAGGPLLLLIPPAIQAGAAVARLMPTIIRTLGVIGSGCAIGLATELSNNPPYAGAVFGSSMGTVVNMWPGSVTLSRILKGMGLGGAASVACDEGIHYVLEPQFVEDTKEMFPLR